MKNFNISLADIFNALNEEDILRIVAAFYVGENYDIIPDNDDSALDEFYDYVYNCDPNLLINIQNTLANVDRAYDEDEPDYDEEDWEEDYDCDEEYYDDETEVNEEDVFEKNRRKNEEALGVMLP